MSVFVLSPKVYSPSRGFDRQAGSSRHERKVCRVGEGTEEIIRATFAVSMVAHGMRDSASSGSGIPVFL